MWAWNPHDEFVISSTYKKSRASYGSKINRSKHKCKYNVVLLEISHIIFVQMTASREKLTRFSGLGNGGFWKRDKRLGRCCREYLSWILVYRWWIFYFPSAKKLLCQGYFNISFICIWLSYWCMIVVVYDYASWLYDILYDTELFYDFFVLSYRNDNCTSTNFWTSTWWIWQKWGWPFEAVTAIFKQRYAIAYKT